MGTNRGLITIILWRLSFGLILLFVFPLSARSQCTETSPGGAGLPPGINYVGVFSYGFSNTDPILNGLNMWNSGCGSHAGVPLPYPHFIFGATSGTDAQITISLQSQRPTPDEHGVYPIAEWRGATNENIVYQLYGPDLDHLQPTPWNDPLWLDVIVGHEIGHALNLGDDNCAGDVMEVPLDQFGQVTQADCYEADDRNMTYAEQYGCQPGDPGCEYSPVLINMDGGEYRLTGLDDPVSFDINGDGRQDQIGWTAEDSRIAFLWLDRDGNGKPDSGLELFGNATRLADGSRAANGFEALTEFDANNDGLIDSRDPIWSRLMLWID